MKVKHVVISLVVGAVLAMPLGGFFLGFVQCEDCGANIFGRALLGLVFAVLTPLSGGFPPRSGGGASLFNAWPHILIAWALISGCALYFFTKK